MQDNSNNEINEEILASEELETANSEEQEDECITIMQSEYDSMKEKSNDLEDKLLRMAAEYDNFKKRSAKDKEAIYCNSVCDIIESLLPIMDNLERAIASTTDNADVSVILDGINMVKNQFDESLEKLGVTPIESLGKKFDPNFHNAVMHVEDENSEEHTVVEEFMKGYSRDGKVIRHSMVKVAN